jgi:predicted nuclease of predicted toxin-antitoxin system
MNLAVRWASMLSARGIEAIHWSSVGKASAPDDLIMAHAKDNGYAILTKDLDFSAILAATHSDKPSVIQIRAVDSRPEKILEPVCLAINRFSTDIERGAILTLDMQTTRIHILPFIVPPKEKSHSSPQ